MLLEPAKENDVLSKFVDIFLLVLIFLNVLMVILETVDDLFLHYNKLFRIFVYFSVLIFSLEGFAIKFIIFPLLPFFYYTNS